MTYSARQPRMNLWLGAGLLVGLMLALAGLMLPQETARSLPANAAAQVDGRPISRAAYNRALQAVAADKRDPLGAEDRRQVLQRLIDEALLLRYGEDLGLVWDAQPVRDRLMDAVLAGVRAEAQAETYDEAELRAFYREHDQLFRGPDLLRVGVITTADQTKATAAGRALTAGDDFNAVRAEYGEGMLPLPDLLLPADKLRDYLGPKLTRRAEGLKPGEHSGPLSFAGGYAVLVLRESYSAQPPPFEEVETAVRHEMQRRIAESLLRRRLAALRERYPVTVADDLR